MIFARQPAIGFLDVFLLGISGNAEYLVVILVFHGSETGCL
jgi:hypothetical protein